MFLDTIKDNTSLGGKLAHGIFQVKKWPRRPIGLADMEPPSAKCPTVADEAGKAKDPPRQTSPSTGTPGAQVNPTREMATEEARDVAATNRGGRGVGESSGNHHCVSQWKGSIVNTHSTCTHGSFLPVKAIFISKSKQRLMKCPSTSDIALHGHILTFNRYQCHWSPRDWKQLLYN